MIPDSYCYTCEMTSHKSVTVDIRQIVTIEDVLTSLKKDNTAMPSIAKRSIKIANRLLRVAKILS